MTTRSRTLRLRLNRGRQSANRRIVFGRGDSAAPVAPVSVTVGGQAARVVSATAQPMRVSGMLQVTAEIPEGVGSGLQPVVLKIGDNDNAQQNVTVWVR